MYRTPTQGLAFTSGQLALSASYVTTVDGFGAVGGTAADLDADSWAPFTAEDRAAADRAWAQDDRPGLQRHCPLRRLTGMRRLTGRRLLMALGCVLALLAAGCSPPAAEPDRPVATGGATAGPATAGAAAPSTPPVTSTPPASDDEAQPVAVRLLGVAPSQVAMGTAEYVTDAPQFEAAWARYGLSTPAPTVDFDRHIVVLLARAEDACPDLVGGLDPVARAADQSPAAAEPSPTSPGDSAAISIRWVEPGKGCEQPLIPTAFALRIHRGAVPAEFTLTEPGFADEYAGIDLAVTLSPYDGPPPGDGPAYALPPPPAGTRTGRVPLPPTGTTELARRDDGLPVWVTHRPGDTVLVLAADRPDDSSRLPVDGLRAPVAWLPSLRRFAGGGQVFDARGLSLSGLVVPPLDVIEAAVDGDAVVLGARRGQSGDPAPELTATEPDPDAPRSDGLRALAGEAVPLDAFTDVPDGTIAVLDADLVVYGEKPPTVCKAPAAPAVWDWTGCPPGSPRPAGLVGQGAPGYFTVIVGPLLVRHEGGELTDVMPFGGGTLGGVIPGVRLPPPPMPTPTPTSTSME